MAFPALQKNNMHFPRRIYTALNNCSRPASPTAITTYFHDNPINTNRDLDDTTIDLIAASIVTFALKFNGDILGKIKHIANLTGKSFLVVPALYALKKEYNGEIGDSSGYSRNRNISHDLAVLGEYLSSSEINSILIQLENNQYPTKNKPNTQIGTIKTFDDKDLNNTNATQLFNKTTGMSLYLCEAGIVAVEKNRGDNKDMLNQGYMIYQKGGGVSPETFQKIFSAVYYRACGIKRYVSACGSEIMGTIEKYPPTPFHPFGKEVRVYRTKSNSDNVSNIIGKELLTKDDHILVGNGNDGRVVKTLNDSNGDSYVIKYIHSHRMQPYENLNKQGITPPIQVAIELGLRKELNEYGCGGIASILIRNLEERYGEDRKLEIRLMGAFIEGKKFKAGDIFSEEQFHQAGLILLFIQSLEVTVTVKVKETQQSLTAYFGVRDGSKPENYIEAGTNGNCGLALVDADFTKMITVIDSTGKEISGNDIEGNAREFGGFLLFGPIKPNDVNQINIIADTYLEFRKELNKVGLSNRAINALQPLAGLALSIFKENDPKLYKKLLYNKNDLYYKLAENLNQIERIIIDNIKEDKVFKVLPKDKYAKFAANWLLRTEAKAIKDFYEQHIQVLTAPTIALYLNQARGGQQKDKVA